MICESGPGTNIVEECCRRVIAYGEESIDPEEN